MKREKSKIAILSVGGTILSRFDVEKKEVSLSQSAEQLTKLFLEQSGAHSSFDYELLVEEMLYLPSPHLTLEHAIQISERVAAYTNDDSIGGIVVLHGTDTMEEVAYFVHLTVNAVKPIVFTGSMKSEGERYADAIGNLNAAIRVAANAGSSNNGVLVVMNEEIHSAAFVTKVNSEQMDAFHSPQFGPIGKVSLEQVRFFATLTDEVLADHGRFHPKVESEVWLLKAFLGMPAKLIELTRQAGIKGLVIEAFGAGNLHPDIADEAERLIQNGIPVIVATRCLSGRAHPHYGYVGGGKELLGRGFMFGGDLSGVKCRIKLMLALGNGVHF